MTDQQHQYQERASRLISTTVQRRISEVGEDIWDRHLPRLAENLAGLLIKLRDSVVDVPQERLRELLMLGKLRASKVAALEDLDQHTRERISPKIAAAERSLEVRSSWIRAVDGLPDHFPVVYVVLASIYIAIGLGIFRWVGEGAPAPKIVPLVLLVALLFIVSSVVVRMFHAVLRSPGRLLAIVVLPIAFAGLGRNPDWWQELLNRWLLQVNLAALGTEFGDSINNALGIAAAFYAGLVVHRLIVFVAHAIGPQESEADLVCATLLNGFLDIALVLQRQTSELSDQADHHANAEGIRTAESSCDDSGEDGETEWGLAVEGAGTGLRLYIADDNRLRLLQELDSLARFTERQWRRALRTGDRTADLEVDRIAAGIATRIRHWKAAAALGGAEFVRMRKAFSTAVVNIADEDWKAMSVEVSDRDLFGRKLVQRLRRIAAAIMLLGTFTILLAKPFTWIAAVHETGMAPVAFVLAGAAAVLLDPQTHDRVVGHIRQASAIKENSV